MTTATPTPNSPLSVFWKKLARFLPLPETLPDTLTLPEIRHVPFEDPVLQSLQQLLGSERVNTTPTTLAAYTIGKNYPNFVRRASGIASPQAVVCPQNEQEIAELMLWAGEREVQLFPWDAESPAVEGKARNDRTLIMVDLALMNRVLEFNEVKHKIRLQAGIRWSQVQEFLADKDLTTGLIFPEADCTVGSTLGHNTFALKTLGYGSLQENAHAVRAITPCGPLHLERPIPGEPDARGLMIGTRQRWGIITEATLRLVPRPSEIQQIIVSFPSWDTALTGIRRILQQGLLPSCACILSTDEVALFSPDAPFNWVRYLRSRLSGPTPWVAHLALELEGTKESVANKRHQIEALLKDVEEQIELTAKPNSLLLDLSTHRRALIPQLWEHNVLAHTVTAAVPWAEVANFRRDWEEALQSILQATGESRGLTLTMIHATEDHALLNTLLLGMQSPERMMSRGEQLGTIEAVAREALRRWAITPASSALLTQALNSAGEAFDPDGVMLR